MSTVFQKPELRQQMRAQRLQLTPADVQARSKAICARLAGMTVFLGGRHVFTYVSRGNEVQTHELIRDLLMDGKRVGVPTFDSERDAYHATWIRHFPDDLQPGKLDILEPRMDKVRRAEWDKFEVLLIPGLAFDARGHRLGRGKGYFDRMLEQAPGVKVALAYDFEVLAEVPVAAHDVPMDFIVTETRVIRCERK
jgi:5-formyltetrahydrofolate cyclo-ligase